MGVPCSKALGMLRRHTLGASIGASEHDGDIDLAAGHVHRLGGGVDHLVDGLHREVEGHELQDGSETMESCSNSQSRESHFCDGGVNNSSVSVLLPQSSCYLVSSIILCNLLTHDKHSFIMCQFFIKSHVEGISVS